MEPKEAIAILEANAEHPDVKAYYGKLYSPDRLNPFLDSEDGLRVIQPRLDKHVTKGLETWKEKNLPVLESEWAAKHNQGETPEQKRIKAIEQQLQDSKNATLKATLKNTAISKLTELKLPVGYADLVIGADEETTLKNIKIVQDNWESEISKRVDEKFKLTEEKNLVKRKLSHRVTL